MPTAPTLLTPELAPARTASRAMVSFAQVNGVHSMSAEPTHSRCGAGSAWLGPPPGGGGGQDTDAVVHATTSSMHHVDQYSTSPSPTRQHVLRLAAVVHCGTNNGGCSGNATCTNIPEGHKCACNPGFIGDGNTCTRECVGGGCRRAAPDFESPCCLRLASRAVGAEDCCTSSCRQHPRA